MLLSDRMSNWVTLSVTQCFPLRYKLRPKKQLSIEHILFVPLSGLTDNFEANAGFNINIVPLKVTASKHSFNSQLPKKIHDKINISKMRDTRGPNLLYYCRNLCWVTGRGEGIISYILKYRKNACQPQLSLYWSYCATTFSSSTEPPSGKKYGPL